MQLFLQSSSIDSSESVLRSTHAVERGVERVCDVLLFSWFGFSHHGPSFRGELIVFVRLGWL